MRKFIVTVLCLSVLLVLSLALLRWTAPPRVQLDAGKVSDILLKPPMGLLGEPLGTRLMVEGEKGMPALLRNHITIDSVDGDVIDVRAIEVDGADIQEGVRYTLEGYESGGFSGPPRWLAPAVQQPFQYRPRFVVTKVIEAEAGTKE